MSFGKNWWTSRTLRQAHLRDAPASNNKLSQRQFGFCVSSWAWEIGWQWFDGFDIGNINTRFWWFVIHQEELEEQSRLGSCLLEIHQAPDTRFDSSRREALVTCLSQCWQPRFPRAENWNSSGSCSIRKSLPWGPENCYGLMVLCVESMEIQLAKKVGIFPSDFLSLIFRGMPCSWFRPKISMPLRRRYWQMLLLPRAQGNVEKWQSQDGKMRKDEEGDEIVKPSEIWRWRNMEKPHEVVHSPFWTSSIVFFYALTS